jgi:hypothetical protein
MVQLTLTLAGARGRVPRVYRRLASKDALIDDLLRLALEDVLALTNARPMSTRQLSKLAPRRRF